MLAFVVEQLLDSVPEEGPVGQGGARIVERLVDELVLERLALADVPRVQDEATDVWIVAEVGDRHFGMAEVAGAVAHR